MHINININNDNNNNNSKLLFKCIVTIKVFIFCSIVGFAFNFCSFLQKNIKKIYSNDKK